tara:strand:+ start:1648 stop:2010 length:363 start_codon:yes stop_codon:yes gene_type:complete
LKPGDFLAIKKEHYLEKDVNMQLTILLGVISTVAGIINGGYFSLSHLNIDKVLRSLVFKILMILAITGSIATIISNHLHSPVSLNILSNWMSNNLVVCFLVYSASFLFFHKIFKKIANSI